MPASTTAALTAVGTCSLAKALTDNVTFLAASGTHGSVTANIEGSVDGGTFTSLPYIDLSTGLYKTGAATIASNASAQYRVPSEGLAVVRLNVTGLASGTLNCTANSQVVTGTQTAVLVQPLGYFPGSQAVGASTAAAGTTTTDATVLPAATAKVYPTSAADGTKGVRVDISENVTGNTILVTNTVAAVLKVYPPTGGYINALAVDAAYSSTSGKGALLCCVNGATGQWATSGG